LNNLKKLIIGLASANYNCRTYYRLRLFPRKDAINPANVRGV